MKWTIRYTHSSYAVIRGATHSQSLIGSKTSVYDAIDQTEVATSVTSAATGRPSTELLVFSLSIGDAAIASIARPHSFRMIND